MEVLLKIQRTLCRDIKKVLLTNKATPSRGCNQTYFLGFATVDAGAFVTALGF